MIRIKKSPTADTRTCDFTKVTRETLLNSSLQHIDDVGEGLSFLRGMLMKAEENHDHDKITSLDLFHSDFSTGFAQTDWWDNHRKVSRHHLLKAEDVPTDVNLIDVLELIVDCVMAGKARSGSVYPIQLSTDVLRMAFDNTVELMKRNVEVVEDIVK